MWNVNPEQIFNIIDLKVVDEYGELTGDRKVYPHEWNQHYHEIINPQQNENKNKIPESIFKIPNVLNQLSIFFIRDVKSKLTNTQYMIITFLSRLYLQEY